MLQNIRYAYGKPMHVNSGYRCSVHNAEVGGKPDSAHLRGFAADIDCPDNHERYLLIRAGMKSLCTRMEANVGKGWVHFDCDDSKPKEVIF
jgi:zinc D-Ala-D-Ala carboxypeptidase